MLCQIVAEGPNDERFLERLIEDLPYFGDLRFTHGTGRSASAASARTIAVVNQRPVVLVVDADTTNPAEIRALKEYLLDSLNAAGSGLARVVLAVPAIEACLFQAPQALRSLVGKDLDPVAEARAEFDPKRVLGELDPSLRNLASVLDRLSPEMLCLLRQTAFAAEVRTAVEELVSRGQVQAT